MTSMRSSGVTAPATRVDQRAFCFSARMSTVANTGASKVLNAPAQESVQAPAAQLNTTTKVTNYYYLAGKRIAVRTSTTHVSRSGTVVWLANDHLGSASVILGPGQRHRVATTLQTFW
jgi:hypothetical protein